MLRKAELDRLGIEAILPDLERQLLLSSVEPSLAIWLKTNTPDFESTDPSDLAKLMIIRDQVVRSAQKSHKHGGQNNCGAPQRNLNAMVKRKGQSNSGQFKRKNSLAHSDWMLGMQSAHSDLMLTRQKVRLISEVISNQGYALYNGLVLTARTVHT
jgi:hypothetical protein